MFASLKYYWLINLLIVIAVAVACATVTGALLVGDSVRGSLRDLTLDRLGRIDEALVAPRFFGIDLAGRLQQKGEESALLERVDALIAIRGAVVKPRSNRRASQVNIYGIAPGFEDFFSASIPFDREPGQIFPSIVLNQRVQAELDVQVGDQVLLHLPRESHIHRESLLGRRDPEDQIQTLRLTVREVIPNQGPGRFSLRPEQAEPLNIFTDIEVLQRALERPEMANALVASRTSDGASEPDLASLLKASLRPADLGLKVLEGEGYFVIESDQFVLAPGFVSSIRELAQRQGRATQDVITYLANEIRIGERSVPYSTISAVELPAGGSLPGLTATAGPISAIRDDEVFLSQWASQDLGALTGDRARISYYAVGPGDQLRVESVELRIGGIATFTGLAADPRLTPEFPGIHEAEDMKAWDPPFPVDLDAIRPKDEAYWDDHKSLPKAFVSAATGARLWSSRFGSLTSIRVSDSEASRGGSFVQDLITGLDPRQSGFVFRPVKAQGLAAASGPTDFSGLFIGFSLFLIVSALLLVSMLFRLSTERRSPEVGLLLSVGYPPHLVLKRLLGEGLVLSLLGGIVGLPGAALFAATMMLALRTWWLDAVGTSFLFLHVTSLSLILGYVISCLAVIFSIWLAIRKMVRQPKPGLLRGVVESEGTVKSGLRARQIALTSLVLALAMLAWGALQIRQGAGSGTVSIVFFLVGSLLLTAGLCGFSARIRGASGKGFRPGGSSDTLRMAARNASRNPQRSVLSTALVACACFVIVAVGMFRSNLPQDSLDRTSGTGGFSLVATSDIPLLQDLSDSDARFDLGIPDSNILDAARFFPFRVLPGDDTSCLNLYEPQQPRVLGVPASMVQRGGFSVDTPEPTNAPWRLLDQDLGEGVIPAFGDHESVLWILKLGLGDELEFIDDNGQSLRLRLVGLIQNSIFQSELLISEDRFLKHFPRRTGYQYFLIDSALEQGEELTSQLEDGLSRFGFDVSSTGEKLARYQAVRGTYISTFQTLGGFGLLLGTLGLGVILVRNVVERRRELATLRAFGFRRAHLGWLVVAENAFLLVVGILLGGGAALVAVAPLAASGGFPLGSLALTLTGVLATGMLACLVAVRAALRIPMLPALKAD